jgi:hypothetical protein
MICRLDGGIAGRVNDEHSNKTLLQAFDLPASLRALRRSFSAASKHRQAFAAARR